MSESPHPFLRKLSAFSGLSARESAHLNQLLTDRHSVAAGDEMVRPHHVRAHIYVLLSGWAIRFKLLPDGRRQILNFVLPGDFMGMRAHLFGMADHSISMLTDGAINTIPADRITALFQDMPRLAAAITWSAAREEAMLAEQIVRLGRRNAYERLAHLFMELLTRLRLVGGASAHSYVFPVTQEVLADLLGLSVVHVNRTLRALRKDGLIEMKDGAIIIKDVEALGRVAAFDPDSLGPRTLPYTTRKELDRITREQEFDPST